MRSNRLLSVVAFSGAAIGLAFMIISPLFFILCRMDTKLPFVAFTFWATVWASPVGLILTIAGAIAALLISTAEHRHTLLLLMNATGIVVMICLVSVLFLR